MRGIIAALTLYVALAVGCGGEEVGVQKSTEEYRRRKKISNQNLVKSIYDHS